MQATLEGCEADGTDVGVAVFPGEMSRIQIARCHLGVLVGLSVDMLEYGGGVCGRSGGTAVANMWARLRNAGGTGVPGAQCMHDAAYACAAWALRTPHAGCTWT